MKNRQFFWIVVVLAIIIGWLLFKFRETQIASKTEPIAAVPSTDSVLPMATNIARESFEAASNANAKSGTTRDDIAQRGKDSVSKEQAMQESLLAENLRAQDFYGKIIDQDGNSLSGVFVAGELVLNDGTYGGIQTKKYSTVSDENGLFEFSGIHGAGFSVHVNKAGYEAEGKNQIYKGPVGNKTSPVDRAIYTMWSTNIHEHLITGNRSFEIVPDGRPYFINLTDGTISESEGHDLKVWVTYTNQAVKGQLNDWSAGIVVANGGLFEVPQDAINSGFVEEPSVPMYSAPEEGYVTSFNLERKIKVGQSGEIGNRYFYLLLKDGKEYGKMSINMFAPYGRLHPGLVRISYAINPSGSRILR